MTELSARQANYFSIPGGVLLLAAIPLTSFHGYLLFHSLVEMFSIIVACGIFMVAWNSRRFHEDNFFLLLGIAYLFVGVCDLLHTLAYKGMGVFPGFDADPATQLWIIARYVESVSIFIAFRVRGRKINPIFVFQGYFVVTALLLGSVFYRDIFPQCLVEGRGLTLFKIISEYIISLVLAVSIGMLIRRRKQFDPSVFRLLTASMLLTIASELAFTLYIDVDGLFNMAGHLLKLVSFYLVYKAIIETGLSKPFGMLFRTLKQKEASLREAKAAAERANRAKSVFLANMSHELRTPLHSILAYARSLKQETSDTRRRRGGAAIIEQSGNQLLELIDEVLDMARIESGRAELIHSDVHLPSLLSEVCGLIDIRARAKGLDFIYRHGDFAGDGPVAPGAVKPAPFIPAGVRCDGKRLRQVLMNLLGNAVKFTDAGSVTLGVAVVENVEIHHPPRVPHAPSPVTLRFQVEDTGIGIAPEALETIFEPFRQVEHPHPRTEGAGLGLAISRNFIRLMGGDLTVESRPGRGSVFRFDVSFPVAAGMDWGDDAEEPVLLPDKNEITALYELSLMGDVRGLEERISRLEQSSGEWVPFVKKIRRLIKGYRVSTLTGRLAKYLETKEMNG